MKYCAPTIWILLALLHFKCGTSGLSYRYTLQTVTQGEKLSDDSARIAAPLTYENNDFKILWAPSGQQYLFRIENKTAIDMQVLLDKSYFIGPEKSVYTIVHPGNSSLSGAGKGLTVLGQTSASSWLTPGPRQSQQQEQNSFLTGWAVSNFFPSSGDLEAARREYIGKIVGISLVLQQNSKLKNYRFLLKVSDIVQPEN